MSLVVMLSVIIPNVVMLLAVAFLAEYQYVACLNAECCFAECHIFSVTLDVTMLSVVIYCNAYCRYPKCRFAGCRVYTKAVVSARDRQSCLFLAFLITKKVYSVAP
jgi:hypothetical protein